MDEILDIESQITQMQNRSAELLAIIDGSVPGTVARALTSPEQSELNGMSPKLRDLETKLATARSIEDARKREATQRAKGGNRITEEAKISKRYSVSRAMKHAASHETISGLDGLEREMHDEATKIAQRCDIPITGRGVLIPTAIQRANSSTPLAAGNLIDTELMPVIQGYQPKIIVEGSGAVMYKNLTGVKSIPISDLTGDAGFVGESSADNVRDLNIRKKSLTPRAIRAKIKLTWLLKAFVGPDLDQIAVQRLNSLVTNTVSRCIIKGGGPNEPTGIMDDTDVPELDLLAVNGRVLTFNDLINLQTLPATNDAENFTNWSYVTTPGMRGALQRTRIEPGQTDMVWDRSAPDMLNGYPALVTTLAPSNLVKGSSSDCNGIAYGAMSELHVAQWALMEMYYDNSKDDDGAFLKVINFYDYALANAKAWAKILASKVA